ncbi:MAG: hypothetical protein OSB70_15585 [Myxococcota bacterium]|nr:hypothetical protein [Myxococcota bacterium]
MAEISPYEVRCPSCNVSFPVGTRRCMHCGGRTGPSPWNAGQAPPDLLESYDARQGGETELATASPELEPLEIEESAPRGGIRGRLNAGMSLIWIVLAVGFSIMRACGEG